MKTRRENDEVLYVEDSLVSTSQADLAWLKERAELNSRGRIRLCAHTSIADSLHEMLIVLKKGSCIPPHKHPNKSESLHVIEGYADLIMFNDDGEISRVIRLGEYGSGRTFYFRINTPVYHTLLIQSDFFIFHETISGPFQIGSSVFIANSPDLTNPESCRKYVTQLESSVENFLLKSWRLKDEFNN